MGWSNGYGTTNYKNLHSKWPLLWFTAAKCKKFEKVQWPGIDLFRKNGWIVESLLHKGQEPPQHMKYLFWLNILSGNDKWYPKFFTNGKKCKYTLISMNNTRVINKNGKFEKDKSSERNNSIMQVKATHLGDAVDKRMRTKYGYLININRMTFVAPRI